MTHTPAVDSLEQVVADMRAKYFRNSIEHEFADRIAALTRPPGGSERLRELSELASVENIQAFARAYKAEVPNATLTVHGIAAGLTALASPQGAEQQEASPEDRFEQFVQAGIARSPEPLRELGEYLGRVLDEDKFPTADRLLLQLATAYAIPHPEPAAPQADQQGEECPHDWYPYVQALYKRYGPVTMDDKGIAGYETLGRMCAECGKIEAPAKPSDQQGADEVEQAADTGYTDPEPADTQGYLTSDGSLTYTGQRKVVEHATTELGTALALLQSVQQRLEAIDCQPLPAALSSPTGVQAAQVSDAVNRFLGWKLPRTFCPDGGISFTPIVPHPSWQHDCWPIGTNLFSADQAQAMFEHCLAQPGDAAKPAERDNQVTFTGNGRSATFHVDPSGAVIPAGAGRDDVALVGELIRTQDNRITDSPIFIVQQKRKICGVDADYTSTFDWLDPRDTSEVYDDARKAEKDADRAEQGLSPIEWRQGGYIEIWEFVTACFTEQGCKDYIAKDAHNLKEPRIYAAGSYRNEEWRTVRKHLMALASQQAVKP